MTALAKLHKLFDRQILAKNLRAARQEFRGVYWDAARPEVPDPVFVVGCSRSGTTVTYETLAASHAFASFGYEIPSFWNGLYGPLNNGWESEAADARHARPEHRDMALRFFYQRLGPGWVLDKTCINTLRLPYLYALFPNAKFVFIQRDGRDNISSMMDGWRQGRTDGHFGLKQFLGTFPEPVSINGGQFEEWHFFLPPGWRAYSHVSLEEACAFQWITANERALQAKEIIPPRQWIHLKYEDLFERPVEMFEEAFEQLAVPFSSDMRKLCANLRPTSIVKGNPQREKWRENNPDAINRIMPMIQPMLAKLDYDANA
jgi:hypothetical protein